MSSMHDSLERALRIDAVCEKFEAALEAGAQPALAEYVASAPDELRPQLEKELQGVLHEFLARRDAGRLDEHIQAAKPGLRIDSARPPEVAGYEIVRELGRGGMGVVYQARQASLKRLVALKMIIGGAHAGGRERERIRTEAEAVARLQHPNVVQIYEIGERDGLPFLSLEYVEGGTLADRLAGPPLAAPQAAHLVEVLARAMHAAHVRGIVHRDLKPANILLSADGVPKISDFGLAKQLESTDGPTQTGAIVGTPSYMAPEQAAGRVRDVGPLADVHALGAILYELLTSRPPYRGTSALETLEQVKHHDPVPPCQLRSNCPRDLQTICLKCLAKDPARRYSSALALAEDLARFQSGQAILARREGPLARLWRRARRSPLSAAALVAIALAGATVAVFALRDHETRRLAGLQKQFEAALQQTDWTPALLDEAEERALALSDPEPARRRVQQQASAAVRDTLRQPRLPAGDVERLQELLHWLRQRDPARAGELAQAVQQRLRAWETVIDLRPPFAQLDQALDPDQARAADGGLLRSALEGVEPIVLTKLPCSGNAQLQAEFTAGAGLRAEIGLHLSASQGHHRTITDLAFSPDSKTLATADSGGEVRLWDIASARERLLLRAAAGRVNMLSFSADGKCLAAAAHTTVVAWDTATGELLTTLDPGSGSITALAFSPDGARLAVGAANHTIQVWDWASRSKNIALAKTHKVPVTFLAFTPQGALVSGGNTSTMVKVWDLDQRSGRELTLHEPARDLALAADGRTLASVGQGVLRLWDVAGGKEIALLSTQGSGAGLTFSPDGKSLATGGASLEVWNVARRRRRPEWESSQRHIRLTAWSPDGSWLATVPREHTVQLWDTATANRRLTLGAQGYAFLLSPPETAGAPWRLQIVRSGIRQRAQEVQLPAGPLRLRATREGDRLQFQLNDLPPVEFRDLFPLSQVQQGVYGLTWPAEARLERLRAARQALPALGSPLERADEYHGLGRYAEALELYQEQSIASGEQEAGCEARCKAALCLAGLNRIEDAARLFERVAAEPGGRWPVVAASQLWLLRLRQQRFADADAAFEHLSSRHRFEELATLVPEEVRYDILHRSTATGMHLAQYNPHLLRDSERADAVAEYLQVAPSQREAFRFALMRACRLSGDEERALAISGELLQAFAPGSAQPQQVLQTLLPERSWILRRRGEAQAALAELDRWLFEAPGVYRVYAPSHLMTLLIERARIHAALEQWDQAERDIDAALAAAAGRSVRYLTFSAAYLLKGFLCERRGDAAGAQAAWQAGVFNKWKTLVARSLSEAVQSVPELVQSLILGSLSGDFDDAEAEESLRRLVLPDDVSAFVKTVGVPPAVWRQMWRTPRGKEAARQIAFQSLSFADNVRLPLYLTAAGLLSGAVRGTPSADQQELIWQLTLDSFAAYYQGKVTMPQVLLAAAAWKGTTSVFGWAGLAPTLDPALRGPIAYLLGLRYRDVLRRPADAGPFFRAATGDAALGSLLERLVAVELFRTK